MIPAAQADDAARIVGEATEAEETRGQVVRVLGPDGAPMSGVAVGVLADWTGAERPTWMNETTDRDGRVRFYLAPGSHFVWANGNVRTQPTLSDAEARLVVVEGAEAAPETVLQLLPLDGAVVVRVVTPSGQPVEGIRIRTSAVERPGGVTNEDGVAVISRLPCRPLDVYAETPDADHPHTIVEGRMRTIPDGRSAAVVTFIATPWAEIQVTYRVEEVGGKPVTASELSVSLSSLGWHRRFALAPGATHVERCPPAKVWTHIDAGSDSESFVTFPTEFEHGTTASQVDFVASAGPGTFSGRVVDAAGLPLEKAFVALGLAGTQRHQKYTYTDAEGRYTFRGLPEAAIEVFASPPHSRFDVGPRSLIAVIKPPFPRYHEIGFEVGYAVAVRLADGEKAVHATDYGFEIHDDKREVGARSQTRDETCTFVHLLAGRYEIRLKDREGRTIAERPVELPRDADAQRQVRLTIDMP